MCQECIKDGHEDKFARLVQECRAFEEKIRDAGGIRSLPDQEIVVEAGRAALILQTEYNETTNVGKNTSDGLSLVELDMSSIGVEDIGVDDPIHDYRGYRVA